MVDKLASIQKLLTGFIYNRDIEDVVFDYNGQKGVYPHNCPGKRIIEEYNQYATLENNYNMSHSAFYASNKLELITMPSNTICFWIQGDTNPDSITVHYFKEFMIIKTQSSSKGHWVSPPAKYKCIRHYFTPDVLLMIKHFSRIENHEYAMSYIKQNPHYFKHHTVDSIEIFKKTHETIKEVIKENNTKEEVYLQLEQKVKGLEIEKELLQKKISEMEETLSSASAIKVKQD